MQKEGEIALNSAKKAFPSNAVFALVEGCWKCKQSKEAPADTAW